MKSLIRGRSTKENTLLTIKLLFSIQKTKNKIKPNWFNVNGIEPTESLAIVNSSLKFLKDSSFEIVETVQNSGAGALFNKTAVRKFTLRAATEELCVDWIAATKGMKK